ncbi:hypothetical protein ACOMHN_022949 [Nucella lapillus]
MTNNQMQGRRRYYGVTATLQTLTLSSPQSENEHNQARKVEGALSRQDKTVTEPQRPDDLPDVRSTESFQGQPLHETPPQFELPAGTQPRYEVDGPQTTTTNSSDLEEEQYNSLPATVVGFEERTHDVPYTSSQPGTPETTESQTSSSRSESRQPSDGTSEGSGASSLSWTPNIPEFNSIMPSSSEKSDPTKVASSVADVEGAEKKGVVYTSGSNTNLNIRANVEVEGKLTKETVQGFLRRSPAELTDYLTRIVFNEPDFGIYVSTELTPSRDENNVECYRCNKEFNVVRTIARQGNHCGVFVCEDNTTNHQFVWKKIMKTRKRLIGIEFLTQHDQDFLPKIYAVYKEKETINIFQEYIKGGMLLHTCWDMGQIRELAEQLLTAVHYLHTQGLVHNDIKLRNLMVRDVANPATVVLIDFESAKHCSLPFHKGGYTLTYLPPWHEKLLDLEEYNELLKTADLWAIACVIIFFLIPSARCDLESQGRGEVWSQALTDIKADCEECRNDLDSGKYCPACRDNFLHFVAENGHTILHRHLGHWMESQCDDPDWRAVRQLLQYLTDLNNLTEKHVGIALSLIKRSVFQPANESDYDTNPRSL